MAIGCAQTRSGVPAGTLRALSVSGAQSTKTDADTKGRPGADFGSQGRSVVDFRLSIADRPAIL
jgi:hypothetical protein